MAVVISVINLKGGVGKSTLAMILSEHLVFRFNKSVLLIDMDAQANLSYLMVPPRWISTQEKEHRTMYDFFKSSLSGKQSSLSEFIARPPLIVSNIARDFDTVRGRSNQTLDMVISTPRVAQLDEDLLSLWENKAPMPTNLRYALKEGLDAIKYDYDIILVDCPPGLSFFTSTALMSSDFFVSPVIPEPLSLEGVRLVCDRARELGRYPDCKVEFAGTILNIVKHYRNTHKDTCNQIYGQKSDALKPFSYWLPDNERLRALGEFEIDTEHIKEGWGAGVDTKFHSVYSKYSVSYLLSNPKEGLLSKAQELEGVKYRLHERIERLVQEFGERINIF